MTHFSSFERLVSQKWYCSGLNTNSPEWTRWAIFQELNKSYLKPVFLQTPGNRIEADWSIKNFYFQGTVLWQINFCEVFMRQKRSVPWIVLVHFPMTLLPCNFISHYERMNAICVLHFQQNKPFMHSARIPLRGLRIVLRQLTHVVNFWPKYWFITWVGQPKWWIFTTWVRFIFFGQNRWTFLLVNFIIVYFVYLWSKAAFGLTELFSIL